MPPLEERAVLGAQDKPNKSNYLEMPDGKYGVYVMFTKDEIETLVAIAGRTSLPRWLKRLALDEAHIHDLPE